MNVLWKNRNDSEEQVKGRTVWGGGSGLPEAAKRKCHLIRDVKDRRNVFVEWIRGGELN